MNFSVRMWGVRGSLTTPETPQEKFESSKTLLSEFLIAQKSDVTLVASQFLSSKRYESVAGFGGNTSCMELKSKDKTLIIDGGSGLKNLGDYLLRENQTNTYHILMTHFHWDHLSGLPFFIPLYLQNKVIHFYAVQEELETCIRTLFSKPFHPVAFEQLSAKIHFHKLDPYKQQIIENFKITPYMLDHPDPCYGFKIEADERVLSYCVDHEGVRKSEEELGKDADLFKGVHTLIYDAQYGLGEINKKMNWGHSTASIGIEVSMREQIENVYFVHHDPSSTIENIFQLEREAKKFHDIWLNLNIKNGKLAINPTLKQHETHWHFAYEGLLIAV